MAIDEVIITNPVSVKDTVALGLDNVTDPRIIHALTMLLPSKLDSTTTPPATLVWSDQVALSGGAVTLDLEALVNANLPNINFVGLKVQCLVMSCPAANTQAIVIVPGASNDYDIGGASMSFAVSPGGMLIYLSDDDAPDVAGADSELDFSGTGTEVFDILMVAG